MRVLHLFKNYYPPTRGGVEQWINDVVHDRSFSQNGIEFVVLTAATDRRLVTDDDEGVRVVRAPAIVRASTAPVVLGWPGWIRRLRPDVVHAHMPNPTGELAIMLARLDAPVVAHYHADIVRAGPVPAIYDRFARRFLRRVHSVAVGSSKLAETTPLLQGVRDRITVIPYGVDVEAWAKRPANADEVRARFPGPLLVLVGRLVHYKGASVLVEAMRDVANADLLVVGDGPLREQTEQLARSLGVADRVHFVGEVGDDDRTAYYHAADIFVLPSVNRGESYGIVQAEAMATGTPSICTEVGTGTSWVNKHGETGLVVPPRDPAALADAIKSLLADDDRRAAMGRAAQQRVREHLSRDNMLAALRELYEDAAATRHSG
jgi:rhamnosyl/mannosyltransferase